MKKNSLLLFSFYFLISSPYFVFSKQMLMIMTIYERFYRNTSLKNSIKHLKQVFTLFVSVFFVEIKPKQKKLYFSWICLWNHKTLIKAEIDKQNVVLAIFVYSQNQFANTSYRKRNHSRLMACNLFEIFILCIFLHALKNCLL